eukprot:5436973-Ditylum_brightwellii.AAC.1
MSVYWDDNPPLLFASSSKIWRKTSHLADAMQAMMSSMDPGPDIHNLFSTIPVPTTSTSPSPPIPHDYCCKPFSFKIRMTFTDTNTTTGPEKESYCQAELLPFHIDIDLLPHQQ